MIPTMAKEEFATAAGTLSLTRSDYKPWLGAGDGECVFFGSIHG